MLLVLVPAVAARWRTYGSSGPSLSASAYQLAGLLMLAQGTTARGLAGRAGRRRHGRTGGQLRRARAPAGVARAGTRGAPPHCADWHASGAAAIPRSRVLAAASKSPAFVCARASASRKAAEPGSAATASVRQAMPSGARPSSVISTPRMALPMGFAGSASTASAASCAAPARSPWRWRRSARQRSSAALPGWSARAVWSVLTGRSDIAVLDGEPRGEFVDGGIPRGEATQSRKQRLRRAGVACPQERVGSLDQVIGGTGRLAFCKHPAGFVARQAITPSARTASAASVDEEDELDDACCCAASR